MSKIFLFVLILLGTDKTILKAQDDNCVISSNAVIEDSILTLNIILDIRATDKDLYYVVQNHHFFIKEKSFVELVDPGYIKIIRPWTSTYNYTQRAKKIWEINTTEINAFGGVRYSGMFPSSVREILIPQGERYTFHYQLQYEIEGKIRNNKLKIVTFYFSNDGNIDDICNAFYNYGYLNSFLEKAKKAGYCFEVNKTFRLKKLIKNKRERGTKK